LKEDVACNSTDDKEEGYTDA
jgi:hypothetical protein